MTPQCTACGKDVLDIDVKCPHCNANLAGSGAHKMIGQVMLGQYELIDVLGQGGMSVVFKGKHRLTDQEVALKILPPELAAHSQVKSRFLDEAKALAALDHPNIVHLYNFGQEAGYFVLAMQFVQGQTWERMILEGKRLDWRASCKVTCDVLRALEYAHGRGVVHRDMKPSNVLVRQHDGSATVMDFGIAKMTTSTRLTATGQTMGTVRYMSPEQVRGQEVDLRTDIYSLGATLYESLTGETPFDGSTHFEIMTKHLSEAPMRPSLQGIEIPMTVEDALMRSLSKRAEDRFESARDMRKILDAALRAADPGLVDTQRVSDAVLAEVRSKVHSPTPLPDVPTRRLATASDLAEELEPGVDRLDRLDRLDRPKRSLVRYFALGLVLAGVAVAALIILRPGSNKPRASGPFAELELQAPVEVGPIRVIGDGTVDAKAVGKRYVEEVARVQKLVDDGLSAKKQAPAKLPLDSMKTLYVVGQAALCIKNAYVRDDFIPKDCEKVPYAISIGDRNGGSDPRIYVVATRVTEALHQAVADAACSFQPDASTRSALICSLVGIETPP